jgi:uncharacterized membrane protein
MKQDDINQQEWQNPQNWSFIVYHSQRDSRMWVPKRRGFGWTINLRNKTGARDFLTLLLLVPIVSLLAALIIRSQFAGR